MVGDQEQGKTVPSMSVSSCCWLIWPFTKPRQDQRLNPLARRQQKSLHSPLFGYSSFSAR